MWIHDETTKTNARVVVNESDDKNCHMPSGSAMASFGGAKPKESQTTNMQCKMENITKGRPTKFPNLRKINSSRTTSVTPESSAISMPDSEPTECARCGAKASFEYFKCCETCRKAFCNTWRCRMAVLGHHYNEPRLVCSECIRIEFNNISSE